MSIVKRVSANAAADNPSLGSGTGFDCVLIGRGLNERPIFVIFLILLILLTSSIFLFFIVRIIDLALEALW